MDVAFFLCAILTVALGKPEGYYRQQYQYQSSSSSYKNNELQRKTDDEGYYAKHGDLEGRVEPKVNSYSQHTDYVNPKLRNGNVDYNSRYNEGLTEQELAQRAESALSHLGTSHSGLSSASQHGYIQSGYASGGVGYGQESSGSISGRRNHYSHSGSYGNDDLSPYGTGDRSSYGAYDLSRIRGGHYDTQSNLVDLTQRLQDDLSRQLQSAISRQYQSSSSHSQSAASSSSSGYNSELRELEEELRANLTRQLQESLSKQYGTQGKRGSYTYTVTSGAYNPTPNYDTQELTDLTEQIQNNLNKQLRETFRNQQSQTSYSAASNNRQHSTSYGSRYKPFTNYDTSSSTYGSQQAADRTQSISNSDTSSSIYERDRTPIANPSFPNYDTSSSTYGSQPAVDRTPIANPSYPSYDTSTSYGRRQQAVDSTPIVNPSVPLVDVVQPVQTEIDLEVNEALNELEHKYINNDEYNSVRPDYEIILQNLKDQVRRNISETLAVALYTSYGTQVQRGSYFLSTSRATTGEQVANYKYEDLENLKKQVEDNLINKLTEAINDQKKRYTEKITSRTSQSGDDTVYTSYASYQPKQQTDRPRYRTQVGSGYSTYGSTSQTSSVYGQESNYGQAENNQQRHIVNRPDSTDSQQLEYGYNPTSNIQPSGSGPTSDSQTTGYRPYRVSNSDSSYLHRSGNRQSGVEYTTGNLRSDSDDKLQTIQQELQQDLSEQVQNVIREQQSHSYSSSSSSSSSASSQAVTDLSEELKRNLTQKLEELLQQHYGRQGIRGGFSYTITTGGNLNSKANYNNQQISDLTARLQEDLLRQLREGLTTQTNQYSASYKPVRAQSNYNSGSYGSHYVSGQYGASSAYGTRTSGHAGAEGVLGDDCMQGDDNFTKHTNEDVTTTDHGAPRRGDTPQTLDSSEELTQKVFDDSQKTESFDLQTEQQTTDEDQRTEDGVVGLEVGPESDDLILQSKLTPNQPVEYLHQQTEDDFGQALEQHPSEYNPLDTQQTEDGFGQLTIGSHQLDNLETSNTQGEAQLSQHEDLSGLSQQTEDLSQHTEDLRQHTQDITQQQADLIQQTQDLSHQQTGSGLSNTNAWYGQNEDLSQQTQQSQDIIQQNIALTQKLADLIKPQRSRQAEDSSQRYGSSDTTYRSPYENRNIQYGVPGYYQSANGQISQQSEELSQNTEDLSQHTEDLSQHTEDLSQHTQDLSQHTQDLSQHTADSSQHTIDLGQHEDLTQQQLDLIQHSQSGDLGLNTGYTRGSGYNVNYQSSQSSSESSSASSNLQNSQTYLSHGLNYGTPQQVPVEIIGDLEQQQVQQQRAHIVQDVSNQAQSPSGYYATSISSSNSSSSSSSSKSSSTSFSSNGYGSPPSVVPLGDPTGIHDSMANIQNLENTTPKDEPGFWKRLGGKISNTYKSAKETISEKIG